MGIKKFELYHGAVLTRILRKDRPLTLTLIETNTAESWSTYKIADNNKDAILYMKYSSAPSVTSKHTRWQYSFKKEHLKELKKYEEKNIYIALIGVQRNIDDKPMEICLLNKEEMLEAIDLDSKTTQSFTVFCEAKKKLRVRGTRTNHNEIKIDRSRIDKLGEDW